MLIGFESPKLTAKERNCQTTLIIEILLKVILGG